MPDANPPAGLFRTPLACALLSGVLAAAVEEAYGHTPYETAWLSSNVLFFTYYFLFSLMLLSGPLICGRNKSTAVRSIAVAIGLATMLDLIRLKISFFWMGNNMYDSFRIAMFADDLLCTGVRSVMLGLFLRVLYRSRRSKLLAIALALLGALPHTVVALVDYSQKRVDHFSFSPPRDATLEYQAFEALIRILTPIAIVVLPTIPIDRAFRVPAIMPGDAHA